MKLSDDMLANGFMLHDCTVYPSRNVIETNAGELHIEPKAMQVLLVLASEQGQVVSRESLLEQVWPDTYSGDAALTRCISLLRTSLGEQKSQHRYIETVSKSGYRLVAAVEALDAGENAPVQASSRGVSTKMLAGIGTLVAIVILVFVLRDQDPGNETPATTPVDSGEIHSIAVLPFSNLSGDPDNEYLSDGVSEEILNVLARIPSLQVTSRSSSFSFKNAGLPLSEIADQLGVKNLLEGSVRKFDERIRISVQLIDARSDVLLWTENYDHRFDDVLLIQDQIARAVAETLKLTLDLPGSDHALRSVEAHEAFLRGRFLAARRTRDSLEEAAEEFKRAIAIEPDHVAAISELAITYVLLRADQYGELSNAEAMVLAEPLAAQALELNPNLAEAQAAAGVVVWRKGQSNKARFHFKEALELNPNYAHVYHWYAMLNHRHFGDFDEAFAASKMARTLDPVSMPIPTIYIQNLITRGRLAEAREQVERLESISPTAAHWLRGELDALGGNWADIVFGQLEGLLLDPNLNRALNRLPREFIRLGIPEEATTFGFRPTPVLLIDLGQPDEAIALAREQLRENPETLRSLARVLAFAGLDDEAYLLLDDLWHQADKRVSVFGVYFFMQEQAVSLYTLKMERGDAEGAAEILNAIEAEIQKARDAGVGFTRASGSLDFSSGLVRFLSGEEEEGLALIEQAVKDGFFIKPTSSYYRTLSAHPGFEHIWQIQEQTQVRELQRLLKVVCQDSPYETAWQPSEHTCALMHP